ncbi:hypothetical protein LguiB_001711 [Lonicera macranthoides]
MTLLASLPRLGTLWFGWLVPQGQPFFNIDAMKLITLQFNDLDQVFVSTNETIGVVNYMEAEGNSDLRLNRLQTIILSYFNGLKAKVLLTKFVLSHSPSLERMVIENRSRIDAKKGLRITTELMHFPRASTKAQIMYLP